MKNSVAIRPVSQHDAADFVSSARRSRVLHRPWVKAPTDTPAFDRYLARFDGITNLGFVVCTPSTHHLVGAVNLTNIVHGVFQSGYLGYFGFAGFEQQGLMKQGLLQVVQHAFKILKLHRLEANIQPANTSSIELVRSCGFTQEGYSPAYLKISGRWCDHERWALLNQR